MIALENWERTGETQFRGFETIENLVYRSTTSEDTVCRWCPIECRRTFIDVQLPGGKGRPWSKVPLPEGWVRIIVNNSCPKGLVEDKNELKAIKEEMERVRKEFPNVAQFVQKEAFNARVEV